MTTPLVQSSASTPGEVDADVVVLFVDRADGVARVPDDSPYSADQLAALGFGGKRDELVRLPRPVGWRASALAFVGTGTAEPGAADLRYAAGAATRRLTGVERVAFALPASDAASLEAAAEGAALGAYDYLAYRTVSLEGRPAPVGTVILLTSADSDAAADSLARASAHAEAVALVRDLVNESPLDLYPETFAERVEELTRDLPLETTVWDEDALGAEGFGGILGVGRGSTRPPRLVKVVYAPSGAERHLALVGKGITFDSGGLSLKPPASMIGMKYDMAGAATALAVVRAVAVLGLPVRVTAWLCLAENMPSGSAIRPGDVLTIHGGRTVEVLNTDAEGRLVLADGLVAASAEHPDAIVDIATLTGAAIVALGNRYIGTFGDDDLVSEVLEHAASVDETLWRMPMPAELRPLLNSDIADIANVKPGNTAGGMIVAAHFLREFVGETLDGSGRIPWVHLDIAGAAQNRDSGYGFTPKGPTGATVRTLVSLAEGLSAR